MINLSFFVSIENKIAIKSIGFFRSSYDKKFLQLTSSQDYNFHF